MKSILKTQALPYCKGCGHNLIAKNTALALENMGLEPLDVIVVTDIGCHGIIDGSLNTHTVHGLHGRSVALGAGVAFGQQNMGKKIIVFIGDGGSTIGLQHILEAARLNINMTVVVHNNMLYGMTGGQTSGLTPCGFRTSTSNTGNPWPGYDICALTHASGAASVSRIQGTGNISAELAEAFSTEGFSLVEVIEICPSYGMKLNPGRKLSEIISESGKHPGKWSNPREPAGVIQSETTTGLLEELKILSTRYPLSLSHSLSIIISGSAGEGVQLAAGFLSDAVVSSGGEVTQKGSYPVTVGVGFSTAELVISPREINFHGIAVPDIAIVTSADGLLHSKSRIGRMKQGMLFIDSSLEVPDTGAGIVSCDFRSMGVRSACLAAILMFVSRTGYISAEAVYNAVQEAGMADKIPLDRIRSFIEAES